MKPHPLLAVLVVLMSMSCRGTAEPPAARGTRAEAEAMLARAAAHYERVGRDQALADFTAKRPEFVDRDLYVFCYGADRTVVAHGADPALVGDNFDDLRDVNGKAFGTAMWDAAQQTTGGRVDYHWRNPASGNVEPKVSTVRRFGDDVCGVGVYQIPEPD